ncbi:hypothetical protein DL96DRAFT_397742 [Flagelloscypha sp. PMI_526]|nr:hypothetical protein DL96DRAFT_397742 [Flagelloscypha sp. PMI_526]
MTTINSQRAFLKTEISSLEARLFVLRSQLNAISTINCLPTDVLLEIIKLVRGVPTSNFGWIRGITDVCSHWRSIALSRRELWATVFLSPIQNNRKQRKPISVLLSRADGFPLTLHTPSSSFLVEDKMVERLGIRIHALRGLYIGTCPSLSDLSHIFRAEAPLLQTLNVDVCTDSVQVVPGFIAFLSDRCPSLQRLRIPSLCFGSADVQALRLMDLSLVEVAGRESLTYQEASIEPYDVLASLAHYRSLRHLCLTGLYLEYYEGLLPSEPLILPLLGSLTLEKANIRSAINVLRFISCPSAFDVTCAHIGLEETGTAIDQEKPKSRLVSELLEIMRRHCRSNGPWLSLYDSKRRRSPYTYGLKIKGNAHPVLDMSITAPYSDYGPNEFYSDLLAPLDPTSFSKISFSGSSLKIANLPFFCACTATAIRVSRWGNLDGLSLATPPGVATVPLPSLEMIEVEGVSGSDLHGLVSTVWWRYRKGLPLPQLILTETDPSDLDEATLALLPLITNGAFARDSSGDTQELPRLDFEDLPISADDYQGNLSDWDVETEPEDGAEELCDEEKESRDNCRAWSLRPEVQLLEDEQSGDDYSPTDSEIDSDSD